MEFKKPQTLKRYSDEGFNSPGNKKKTKLQSTTIATPPKLRKKPSIDPFDDNFSQFFRSQFIRDIADAETSIIQKAQNIKKSSSTNEYNFTQFDGLSQLLNDTQFESSITSGQRFATNECSVQSNENYESDRETDDANEDQHCTILLSQEPNEQLAGKEHTIEMNEKPIESTHEFTVNQQENCDSDKKCDAELEFDDNDNVEINSDFIIQSSQAFLKELSVLQLNISSIVDETINASKFGTQDFLNPDQCQFEVFKSNVTESQYLHLKRSSESVGKISSAKFKDANIGNKPNPLTEPNTEMIEDQLLAEMIFATQSLAKNTEMLEDQLLAGMIENEDSDFAEKLNECIDPDSSAFDDIFCDEYNDKENKPNAMIETNKSKTTEDHEHKEQKIAANILPSKITAIKQPETCHHHSPVTAANYRSMGPFFGLPIKVKKLIRNFKNIDDLYGKNLGKTTSSLFLVKKKKQIFLL